MIQSDFVIVGAGLTGSTIARLLTDYGQEVIILDRKDHIAGNVYDYKHESGAMIHKYGPHYFRCGSEKIWKENPRWPVNEAYINSIVGEDWNLFKGEPTNFEEVCLSRMPAVIYERF